MKSQISSYWYNRYVRLYRGCRGVEGGGVFLYNGVLGTDDDWVIIYSHKMNSQTWRGAVASLHFVWVCVFFSYPST